MGTRDTEKKLRMGWSAPPAAPKCPCCKVSVYPAEAVMASDRKPYHKKCVKCKSCAKSLTPATLNEHQTQLYCLPCYELVYNTNAYSLGSYGGIVTPEDIARREAEERARLEKAERAKRERRCPTCEMKVAMMVTMTMMTMVVTTVMSMVMLLMRAILRTR